MSKIVDTLDLDEPKELKNEEINRVKIKEGDKVLTKEFMQELGLNPTPQEESKKAFDCDISALDATG